MSGITPGLTVLWPEHCPTRWHGPGMPLLSGGLGREGFSRLALLIVGPGGEWRGGQMPRQLHRVAVPPTEPLWPRSPHSGLPGTGQPQRARQLPTCSFRQ